MSSNKMPRLSKTGIEYGDLAWNLYSGCENWHNGICPVGLNCWAKKITERFPSHYPNGFRPTFYPESFLAPLSVKKPKRILVAFMGDLFGDWVDPDKKFNLVMPSGKVSVSMSLKGWIFTTIKQCPQHTFLFKTKCPQNLIKFSPFPPNCFVGVTATNNDQLQHGLAHIADVEAKVKYISFEPLLGKVNLLAVEMVDWLIIGACTGSWRDIVAMSAKYPALTAVSYGKKWTLQPPISLVQEIVQAAEKAGVRVFLKNNLKPLFRSGNDYPLWANDGLGFLRQEMPIP